MFLIHHIRNFYGRFERPISSLSLIGGFVFDALTLKRVDTLWENLWVVGHLLIVGTFIVLIHTKKSETGDERNPSKQHFWYVNIMQFFFGGILSTYLVFYFRSADIFVTWPFIFLLVVAFFANESLKRHYMRLSFQISLFFLSIYSFAIFMVPVVLHEIGTWIFLFSGFVSLVLIALFIKILFYFAKDKFYQSKNTIILLVFGISVLINFLYFTNLIPPIPLSLKDAGIYHTVHKKANGGYIVTADKSNWKDFFSLYPEVKEVPGMPVYAFTSIFSPKNLDIVIVHEWQHYDEDTGKWATESTKSLPLIGGREDGFRTYSSLSNLAPGKWRVNVETKEGQVISRLRFTIVNTPALSEIRTIIK